MGLPDVDNISSYISGENLREECAGKWTMEKGQWTSPIGVRGAIAELLCLFDVLPIAGGWGTIEDSDAGGVVGAYGGLRALLDATEAVQTCLVGCAGCFGCFLGGTLGTATSTESEEDEQAREKGCGETGDGTHREKLRVES